MVQRCASNMKHFFFSLKEQQAEIPIRTSGRREKLVLSLSATFPPENFPANAVICFQNAKLDLNGYFCFSHIKQIRGWHPEVHTTTRSLWEQRKDSAWIGPLAWVECSFCSQRELAFMKCASVHGRVNSGCHPLLLPPAILLLMYVLAVFPSSQTHNSDKNKICFHRQLHNQSFAITYLEDLSRCQICQPVKVTTLHQL